MTRSEVLGHIRDAAFERHLTFGRLASDDVCLSADDMENYVGGEITPELCEPDAHFFEGREVGYAVAKDAGVCAAVVEAGYRTAFHNDVSLCLKV